MEAGAPYLAQEAVDLLVSAIVTGYDTGSDLHDSSRGSNSSTFGIGTYHFGIFQLEKLTRMRPDLFSIVRAGKMSRLRVGDCELGYYKVKSLDGRLEQAFPSSENAAYPIRDNVQRLLFEEDDQDLDQSQAERRYLILAHVGNSADGLQKLSLCEPGKIMDGMIVSWSGIQEIFNQATDLAPEMHGDTKVQTVPTEVVQDFELKPKEKTNTKKNHSASKA